MQWNRGLLVVEVPLYKRAARGTMAKDGRSRHYHVRADSPMEGKKHH